MLERIALILIIAVACTYLAVRMWRWARSRACGGCGSAPPAMKSRRADLTVGGRPLRPMPRTGGR